MSEFEFYSHELLASMVQDGQPELLSERGYALLDAAETLGYIGAEIASRMRRVAWEGEAAEAFRAWGQHFGRESGVLSEYAGTVGDAMLRAGTALREAQTTMPPPPNSVESPAARATPLAEMLAESDRQEAIRVVERLASYYQVSSELMTSAEEPRFEQLPLDTTVINPEDETSGGVSPGGSATPAAPLSTAPGATGGAAAASPATGSVTPVTGQTSPPAEPGAAPPTGQPVEVGNGDWAGTSLDSTGVVTPDAPARTGPGGGQAQPVPSAGGGAAAPLPPPGNPARYAPPFAPGGGGTPPRPTPARPTSGGQQQPLAGRPPVTGGRTGAAPPAGGPAARSPMVGRPPTTGGGAPPQRSTGRATEGTHPPAAGRAPVAGGGTSQGGPRRPTGRQSPPISGMPAGGAEGPARAAGRPLLAGPSGTSGAGGSARQGWRPTERGGIVGGVPRQSQTPAGRGSTIPQDDVVRPGRPARRGPGRDQPNSLGNNSYGGLVITGRHASSSDDPADEGSYGQAVLEGGSPADDQRPDPPQGPTISGLPTPRTDPRSGTATTAQDEGNTHGNA